MTTAVVVSATALLLGAFILAGLVRTQSYRSPATIALVGVRAKAQQRGVVDRLFVAIGRTLRGVFRLRSDASIDLQVGRRVMAVAVLALISPPAGVACGGVLFATSVIQRRRLVQAKDQGLQERLVEIIDLYVVALHSGHNVVTATEQVANWVEGEIGEAFRWCTEQVGQGHQQSDVLEDLPDRIGQRIRPLVAALVAHDRHGAPIAQNLAQLAADTRTEQRRQAESSARRLPVTLLFPLVTCVLPAFLLLTVVPVVADAFANLRL